MSGYPMQNVGEGELVATPLRIGLRLLGFIMLVGGLAMLALMVYPGPGRVAEAMGRTCSEQNGPIDRTASQCSVLDVLEIAAVAPALVVIGLVLVLVMRRSFLRPDNVAKAAVWTAVGNDPQLANVAKQWENNPQWKEAMKWQEAAQQWHNTAATIESPQRRGSSVGRAHD